MSDSIDEQSLVSNVPSLRSAVTFVNPHAGRYMAHPSSYQLPSPTLFPPDLTHIGV